MKIGSRFPSKGGGRRMYSRLLELEATAQLSVVMLNTGCSGGLDQLRELISSHWKLKASQKGEVEGVRQKVRESGLVSG